MKFIFGLGNPGKQYKNNRHNIGYKVVEKIADLDQSSFKRKFRLGGLLAIGDNYRLIKPASYMNNSGHCLKIAQKRYGFSLAEVLVVYDDADLELGVIRFKKAGSSGGHRGMQSLIEALGTDQINRLKVGIGRNFQIDTAEYVLSDFRNSELEILEKVIARSASACSDWVTQGIEAAMQKYNSTNPNKE